VNYLNNVVLYNDIKLIIQEEFDLKLIIVYVFGKVCEIYYAFLYKTYFRINRNIIIINNIMNICISNILLFYFKQ